MSNTFACINASVPKSQKIPSSFLCEVFNPNASVSKWANQIVCIKHGKVAYGGTEAIAFSMALCEKNDPNYGKKCFDVLNCMMRVVDEFIGPPTRLNVLCITFALDGLVVSLALCCFASRIYTAFPRRKGFSRLQIRSAATLCIRFSKPDIAVAVPYNLCLGNRCCKQIGPSSIA
jgi:hypothetical protein